MIIPILTAFLTFIGVLAMVGSGRINPDFAWISAGVAGCSTGFVVLAYLVTQDRLRDTPEPRVYKVRLPIAMATVKRALKTFYEKRNRWRINYEDKQSGEIQATFYITDDSLSELAWAIGSERIEKTINLTLFLVEAEFCDRAEASLEGRRGIFALGLQSDYRCNDERTA